VRSSVSSTSAQRFAARRRARRRRQVLIVTVVTILLGGLAWGGLKSPWATVQRIEVTGTNRVAVADVRAEAEPELGHPMLLARTADIAARVGAQRLVRSVRVQRQWPGVITVQVQERYPVAALPTGKNVALVDRDGVVIERARTAPASLPRLEVGLGRAQVPALRGCLAVLKALPPVVAQQLRAIGGQSADGIWLKVRDRKLKKDVMVQWGDADRTPKKARVLLALMSQHAASYDVRSPDMPAYRRK
jgi:cell division protein FtsQ